MDTNLGFDFLFTKSISYKSFLVFIITFGLIIQSQAYLKDHLNGNGTFNNAPVFGSNSYSYTILEQTTLGSTIATVSATDADGDVLIYSIKSGNTYNAFSINSSTGSITLARRLDYHSQNQYNLIIKVNDAAGLSDEALAVIDISKGTDVAGFDTITWSTAANQPYTVSELQGEVVNGKLYTFGGFDSQKPTYTPTSRAYMFDPVLNKWSSIAPMPPMNGTNYGGVTHAGFTTDGTDIYFAGGYTSNSNGKGQKFGTKEVWKYIVSENRYERLPDLPKVIAAGQLEYLAGRLYHIAGTNSSRTTDLGDHYVLNLDSLSSGWKKLAALPNPRQHAASVVYENKIYFIGGQHGHDTELVVQKDVHCYDPLTNIWTKMADLPVPAGAKGRSHISCGAIVIGKTIIVIAGETVHSSKRTNMVSVYTPATNTWKNITPLPQNRYSGVAANLGNHIYYTGGSQSKVTYKGVPFVQQIQNLMLLNADTEQPIKTLVNGDTLNLSTLPTEHLNILANTFPSKVGSVQFSLTGPQNVNITENKFPYSLFGDANNGTDFLAWTPPLGNYILKVTPYSNAGATGTEGPSHTVSFTVIKNDKKNDTLIPLADAFIRNGTYSNTNYGTDTSLVVKTSTAGGYGRSSYLKFSLPDVNGLTSAKLRLYGANSDNGVGNISVYGVANDSWTENNITWKNAPASGATALISMNISTQKYYEFDVTEFVRTQPSGDKLVSFLIKNAADGKFVRFNSKENNINPPQLLLNYQPLNKRETSERNNLVSKPLLPEVIKTPALTSSSVSLKTRVYPNPIHKIFNIDFPNNYKGTYSLQIIDPVGRVYQLGKYQFRQGIYNTKIDVSKLSLKAGIYFLKIKLADKQNETVKLIVE